MARGGCVIQHATGVMGSNRDYLRNTVRHLEEMGIADTSLHRILKLVEESRRRALHERLAVQRPRYEFGRLAAAFNDLLERRSRSAKAFSSSSPAA